MLALAIVGWAGLSGQRAGANLAAIDPSVPPASEGPSGAPVRNGGPDPAIAIPLLPEEVLGLPVRGLRGLDVLSLVGGREVAISGWYEAGSRTGCPPEADPDRPALVTEMGLADWATFCQRSGRLFATSPNASTSGTYRLENRFKNDDLPALGVGMRPGVVVPVTLDASGSDATPVVLVGQLVWPFDNCARFVTRCRPNLRVDRVIWVAGLGNAETVALLPSLLAEGPVLSAAARASIAEETFGASGAVLVEAFVDQPTLAAVDPEAAAAVAAASPDARGIWYRRALGLDPADTPRWVAIDDAMDAIIAGNPG